MEDKYLLARAQEDVLRHLLVGKSIEHARNLLGEMDSKLYIRVVRENGVDYIVTMELNPNRINVHVENAVITEVRDLG